MKLIDDQIAGRVKIIQRVYFVLACIYAAGFIAELTWPSARRFPGDLLMFVLIFIAAYRGLRKLKNWVVPLLLITSIIVLVQILFAALQPATDTSAFIARMVQTVALFFFWYQAFFFSRREVKKFFSSEGTFLF